MNSLSQKSGSGQLRVQLEWFGLTDRGRVRADNEDAFFVNPKDGLFIVSDGMGGANAGRLASEIVVTLLPSLICERLNGMENLGSAAARHKLQAAVVKLSAEIRSRTKDQLGLEGMGATVVLALVRKNRVLIAQMGDSRAYRFRKGSLELLTKDHSLVQALIEHGEITEAEARHHAARNRLTRFVGMKGEPRPDIRCLDLEPEDQFLLSSDGLTNMLTDAELFDVLGRGFSPEQACNRLTEAANEAGGVDNITIVLLRAKGCYPNAAMRPP